MSGSVCCGSKSRTGARAQTPKKQSCKGSTRSTRSTRSRASTRAATKVSKSKARSRSRSKSRSRTPRKTTRTYLRLKKTAKAKAKPKTSKKLSAKLKATATAKSKSKAKAKPTKKLSVKAASLKLSVVREKKRLAALEKMKTIRKAETKLAEAVLNHTKVVAEKASDDDDNASVATRTRAATSSPKKNGTWNRDTMMTELQGRCDAHIIENAVVLPMARVIVALGDVHGDLDFAIRALRAGNVVDEKGNWIGGDAIVVQTGDQLDGCRPKTCSKLKTVNDLPVLEYFDRLNKQAREQKGRVISLLGNHELSNAGMWAQSETPTIAEVVWMKDYVTKAGYDNDKLDSVRDRLNYFRPGNKGAVHLAYTHVPFVIIGDYFFAHAGLTENIINMFNLQRDKLEQFDAEVRGWLLGLRPNPAEINDNKIADEENDPFWHRTYLLDGCDKAKRAIQLLHVKGMIVGHSVQTDGIMNNNCSGKLYRIDVGGSQAFADGTKQNPPSVLVIKNNQHIAFGIGEQRVA